MFFVEETIRQLMLDFGMISIERKSILEKIASFVESNISNQRTTKLVFICTHNSRRSIIAQIWAETAALYFSVANVKIYSGGTEMTAFNINAVHALRKLGFHIDQATTGANPHYFVRHSDDHLALEVFSKKYDSSENPVSGFAAIMTCTQADEKCPLVLGASARISLPFDDPKDFDRTDLEALKYKERALEIGREMLYVFFQIKAR